MYSSVSPYAEIASKKVELMTNGLVNCIFPPLNGNYYIGIKHRNSILTWSATPIPIASLTNYDFTNSSNKAYGNNMIEIEPGVWTIYSGDIDQNENIDLIDYPILETDIFNFEFGYFNTDLNGDGNVDLLDLAILEENTNNFIFSNHP